MFGLGKNQDSSNQSSDQNQLNLQITTMKGDQMTPFQGEKLSVELPTPSEKAPNPRLQEKPAAPEKKVEPLSEKSLSSSPFLNQKASSLPEQSFRADLPTPTLAKEPTFGAQVNFSPAASQQQPKKIQPDAMPKETSFSTLSENTQKKTSTPLTEAAKLTPSGNMPTQSNSNKILLIIATLILLITLGSGGYYYFLVSNEETSPETFSTEEETLPTDVEANPLGEEELAQPEEEIIPPDSELAPLTEETPAAAPSTGIAAKSMALQNNDLVLTLKGLVEQAQQAPDNSITIYSFLNEQAQPLSAKEILSSLKISLPEVEGTLSSAWIAVIKIPNESIKVGLILQSLANPAATIQNLEATLPSKMAGLYFDEKVNFPKNPAFEKSTVDPRVRFVNFTKDTPTLSLDWGVVPSNESFYLVLGTSRASMQQILSQL